MIIEREIVDRRINRMRGGERGRRGSRLKFNRV